MPQNFFAGSDTDTLYPFGGTEYWITVKQELTAGDEREIWQASVHSELNQVTVGRKTELLDLNRGAFTKVAMHLVDWNLTNGDGKQIDITRSHQVKMDALRALKSDRFTAIERAIDQHLAARAQEKKLQNGSNTESGSNKSSPSAGL